MGLTLAFHLHKREQFQQQQSRMHTYCYFVVACRQTVIPHDKVPWNRCRGTLANSCLWLVLTVSDRSKRVKKKKERKSVFCISECVCVHLCHRKCKEPPRDLFSSLTRVGLSSHNPLELLLNRKVKNDAYRSFSFSLCRHTEATLLSAVFTPALFVCV